MSNNLETIRPRPQQQAVKRPGTGLDSLAVEIAFNRKFGFEFHSGQFTKDGDSNRLAKRYGCTIQLIGPAENLIEMGLIVPLSLNDPLTVIRARQYLQTFFSFIPGAALGPSWVEANIFEAVTAPGGNGLKVSHNDLMVELNGIPTKDGLVMTLSVGKR